MPDPTIPVVLLMGCVSGALGALLGIGGGVFLVPFLSLALGLPFQSAAGISLTTVIATSTAVSASTAGRQLINLRLGMLLEVATAAGGLAGGLTAHLVSERSLQLLFGIVSAVTAMTLFGRLERRNVIFDSAATPGRLGGRYFDDESGRQIVYRIRRLPLGLAASFVAGNISSLLGIGGGILKVPVLNVWCGVPMRAAAATSALMIGVTAVTAVPLYYARGAIVPYLAAAAVLGVQLGSRAGFWISIRTPARLSKGLLAGLLLLVSVLMFARIR